MIDIFQENKDYNNLIASLSETRINLVGAL